MEKKMEKSNEETRKTINASVNNNLKDFQATVIESVQEMITTQIDKSNKHMMTGVQEMISKQTEASNKFMIEAIQAAMQVSTINQQQQITTSVLPLYDTTLSNVANNENRQSASNNVITTNSTSQTLTNLTQENRNQPSSDSQVTNTINTDTVNEDDLHWEDMY